MTGRGEAARLAEDLREYLRRAPRRPGPGARVAHVRPVVHGMEMGIEAEEQGGRASVFVFDTGAIVIQGDARSPLRRHLERWKERVIEARDQLRARTPS
jgi:hypothetical protein